MENAHGEKVPPDPVKNVCRVKLFSVFLYLNGCFDHSFAINTHPWNLLFVLPCHLRHSSPSGEIVYLFVLSDHTVETIQPKGCVLKLSNHLSNIQNICLDNFPIPGNILLSSVLKYLCCLFKSIECFKYIAMHHPKKY